MRFKCNVFHLANLGKIVQALKVFSKYDFLLSFSLVFLSHALSPSLPASPHVTYIKIYFKNSFLKKEFNKGDVNEKVMGETRSRNLPGERKDRQINNTKDS